MSRNRASLLLVGALACGGIAACNDGNRSVVGAPDFDVTLDGLDGRLRAGGPVDALVTLRSAPSLSSAAVGRGPPAATGPHAPTAVEADFERSQQGTGLVVLHRYVSFPMLHVLIPDAATLERLRTDPRIEAVHANARFVPALAQSLPLINRATEDGILRAPEFIGAGTSVAVIDTGIDYTRAAFGNCTAQTLNSPDCKVAAMIDVADSDGQADDHPSGHGTAVAGIVVAVAPGAKVIGIDAFMRGGSEGSGAGILAGIDWAISNRAAYNIVALNLSVIDFSRNSSECHGTYFSTPIYTALAAGISVVAPTGNDGMVNGIGAPACVPGVISVGAVYDAPSGGAFFGPCADDTSAADMIPCYSNGASIMTLLAPGTMITVVGQALSGTSMAAPHVAGAVAVLRGQRPTDGPDAIRERLVSTGVAVTDGRAGVVPLGRVHPRLNLAGALGSDDACTFVPGETSVTFPPQGGTREVALTTATACTWTAVSDQPWLTVAPSAVTTGPGSFTLTATAQPPGGLPRSGAVTVGGVRLTVEQLSGDVTPPSNGSLSTKASSGQTVLTVSGVSDNAGVALMTLRYAEGGVPADCDAGTVLQHAQAITRYVHSGLENGRLYGYRLCAIDASGNANSGATALAMPSPEFTRPVVRRVTLNAGVAFTASLQVTVKVEGYDASGGLAVCLKNTKTECDETEWVGLSDPNLHSLSEGPAGKRKVYVTLRDRYRNTSTVREAGILFDDVPPTPGSVKLVAGDGKVTISPMGFADRHSGIGRYRIFHAVGAAPGDCAGVPLGAPDLPKSFVHSGLMNLDTAGYLLCAWDKAGNGPAQASATVVVRPESKPPTGRFSLPRAPVSRGKAYLRGGTSVTVVNSPTDASGLRSMCLTTSPECTVSDWVDYAPTAQLPVASAEGNARVHARYRDVWANESLPVFRDVFIDSSFPTVGSIGHTLSPTTLKVTPGSVSDGLGSGVKRVKTVYLKDGNYPAPDCSDGVVLADSTTGVGSHRPERGSVYRYRVCTEDRVGNAGSAGTLEVSVP